MRSLPDQQADDHQQESVRHGGLTAPTTPEVRTNTELLALEPERREAMVSELEYLLRTHGDEEGRSNQSSLQDVVTGLRQLADDLGLDLGAALADAHEVSDEPPKLSGFDPCI